LGANDSPSKSSGSGTIFSIFNSLKNTTNTQESDGFNAGKVIENSDIYSLPSKFDSIDKIQNYLKSTGSFLANYTVNVDFEDDDDMALSSTTKSNTSEYWGKKMSFSEFIWRMSRTNFGTNCSLSSTNLCVDMQNKPINPAVILSLIQRESGLVYGTNAKLNPNSDQAKFLIERATGYYCLESDNKAKTCYDENPDWKYYKGMFRQVYYGMRTLLLNAKKCETGNGWFGNNYKVGGIITIEGKDIKLENALTCSLYVYTPHVSIEFSKKSIISLT
jgi:hypothetical protein